MTDMFLTMDDVWTRNTFLADMAKSWPIGPTLVLPCFLFALLSGAGRQVPGRGSRAAPAGGLRPACTPRAAVSQATD